ncbi:IniB N-terminal domain-containing protein [Actinomycetospora chiangmaiensis]|uniref:IniB N-terminal domain-containing protein n=1 Tax=Actinomycetospora chiangmaiensis TaxID=402650 RepID=UPI00037BFCFF|nr:IniB N-terminal domain-containing protein [Actinomycetospora chiangmaiensis]
MTDVAPGASLLDWVTGLVSDPATRARFAADPHRVLGEAGLADLDPADLHHAIPLVTDTVAARLDAVADGSTPIPGPLAGESGLEATVRQLGAISDRIVPLSEADPGVRHDAVHDLDHPGAHAGHAVPHDVPDWFDDAPHDGTGDLRDSHDLDDRAPHAWSAGSHHALVAPDHARPAPAFATGHAGHLGVVGPDHPDSGPAPAHDDPWHVDRPEDTAHEPPDEGDHHLDEDAPHHDHGDHAGHVDDTDHAHHPDHPDPGAALGAS